MGGEALQDLEDELCRTRAELDQLRRAGCSGGTWGPLAQLPDECVQVHAQVCREKK